jgi:uncharacterized protein (DUF1697 family)
MERLVAFLRGINVGGHRIDMARLGELVEGAGFSGVDTYAASGNVVLDHPGEPSERVEARLEEKLREALGYDVDTFVRPVPYLRSLLEDDDYEAAEAEGFKIHVLFLKERPGPEVDAGLRELETRDDRLRTGTREILWFRRGRLTDSTIPSADAGVLTGGATATMRTIGTIRRIVRKYG